MSYANKTKNGYTIVDRCRDKLGREVIIAERKKGTYFSPDYLVGAGYDRKSGTWDQGFYDFRSISEAKKFVEDHLGVRESKPRLIACKAISNIGGIEILEANEDYVLFRENFGTPKRAQRSQVRYSATGIPYFIHNGRREYLRDYISCEYPRY